MKRALHASKARGHGAVILLGDAPYLRPVRLLGPQGGQIVATRPVRRGRLLGLELKKGALEGASGMIAPTSNSRQKPRLAEKDGSVTPYGGLI